MPSKYYKGRKPPAWRLALQEEYDPQNLHPGTPQELCELIREVAATRIFDPTDKQKAVAAFYWITLTPTEDQIKAQAADTIAKLPEREQLKRMAHAIPPEVDFGVIGYKHTGRKHSTIGNGKHK